MVFSCGNGIAKALFSTGKAEAHAVSSIHDVAAPMQRRINDVGGAARGTVNRCDRMCQAHWAAIVMKITAAYRRNFTAAFQHVCPPGDAAEINGAHWAVPHLNHIEARLILPKIRAEIALRVVHRNYRAILSRLPHDPPHLLRAVCHKGIAKRPPDPKEIHMALVMRPLHTRDEGDPRKMWQAQVLRIIVVIGHGDKIEALMFGYFSERCNIVLPIGSV